ncbi:MAG: filamentous hemagglutinin N-terminal domain-containing protein, partial [Alphaproteobacteria bacterium]|nr:filamentous hemagglutinin N-terminal domain-containing protein [Alphaproteobacteria bacterium]
MAFFRNLRSRRAVFLAVAPLLAARIACAEPAPNALPTGFSLTSGQIDTPDIQDSTMTVTQHSPQAVIDWQSFNIGRDAHVDFKQPQGGVTVNRITNNSGDPTQIYGKLTANGTIFILDRNGVIFGKSAQVDTAALIASTGNLSRLTETGITLEAIDTNPLAYIENHGSISVADGGLAAFVAPAVRNSGIIRAQLGTAVLASGKTVTLDLHGDGLWSVAVPEGLAHGIAEVQNSGAVSADGGHIYLTVKAAQGAANELVNNTGVLSAQRFSQKDGKIILLGAKENKVLANAIVAGTAADLADVIDSAAADGSTTLHLQSGVYATTLVISKPLTISGDTHGTARIEGTGDGPTITIAADNVTVKYLHIIGGVVAEGVERLRLIGNTITQSGAAAIHLLRTTAAEITDNSFSYSGAGGPVQLEETHQTALSGNLYLGSGDYGVQSKSDTSLQFSDGPMFFGNYVQQLVRLSRRMIDDNRLRLGLPGDPP